MPDYWTERDPLHSPNPTPLLLLTVSSQRELSAKVSCLNFPLLKWPGLLYIQCECLLWVNIALWSAWIVTVCDIIILNSNLLVVEDWRFTCVFFVMKSNSTVIMLSGGVWLSLLCQGVRMTMHSVLANIDYVYPWPLREEGIVSLRSNRCVCFVQVLCFGSIILRLHVL